jgi:hypothetical protein
MHLSYLRERGGGNNLEFGISTLVLIYNITYSNFLSYIVLQKVITFCVFKMAQLSWVFHSRDKSRDLWDFFGGPSFRVEIFGQQARRWKRSETKLWCQRILKSNVANNFWQILKSRHHLQQTFFHPYCARVRLCVLMWYCAPMFHGREICKVWKIQRERERERQTESY